MKKSDINKNTHSSSVNQYMKNFKCSSVYFTSWKVCKTIGIIFLINALVAVGVFVYFLFSIKESTVAYDIKTAKLNLTSFIYVKDENGEFKEYDRVYDVENRVWVDFQDIPQNMINAIIAIEDKRFYDHHGVDWKRTLSAALNLVGGKSSYGGSTLTQQLIKNVTGENEPSITRKVKECIRATNCERDCSKDEIIESYLNVVNFSSGCRGVQSAAKMYFNKTIQECSVAECATIAGITQNPTAFNPFFHPEANRKRRETVINEMFNQGKISKPEFDEAMIESASMKFKKLDLDDEIDTSIPVRNWYVEAMFGDIINDLSLKYKISKDTASEMLFTQGLQIYSAMDQKAQNVAESVISNGSLMSSDKKVEVGYVMMDFNGRVLASVGSREKKSGNLWFDRANKARRQPGSTIKPIAVYAPAIDLGLYNYSSIIPDQPIPNFYGEGKPGPNNWYGDYKGDVTLQWAIQQSANAPAAQVLSKLTCAKSYDFLTKKLGFHSIGDEDRYNMSGFAMGGFTHGVTVKEMAAAFQVFGNGGIYNKPFTYFYVKDRNGNMLLDNTNQIGSRAISEETATIMNRLLREVVTKGTGKGADIQGFEVVGKTGSTNDGKDSWFVGETPLAVAAVWTGYDLPRRLLNMSFSKGIWKTIMEKYVEGKKSETYKFNENVKSVVYCGETGMQAVPGVCPNCIQGYFASSYMPKLCTKHTGLADLSD